MVAENLGSCSSSEGLLEVVVPPPFVNIHPLAPGAQDCSTLTITSFLVHGWSWGHGSPTQNQRV